MLDALTDIISAEFTGTPVYYDDPERFKSRSAQFFSLIPGESTLVQSYAGGSLREYQVAIRYYLRKPRLDNYRTNVFDFMADRGKRLIRLINNKNKYEDSINSFSEIDFNFNELAYAFASIVTYWWHNGRIENIDYSPSRSDREDKRDLQIFEADFLC